MKPTAAAKTARIYNKKHGITPATIVKQVSDVMEAAYPVPGRRGVAGGGRGSAIYEVR